MAGIDRRGFLTGLGALLATSALVKPAAGFGWTSGGGLGLAETSTILVSDVWSVPTDGGYLYSDDRTYFPAQCYEGTIGRYIGLIFTDQLQREDVTVDELLFGKSIRLDDERVPPEDFLLPDPE